MQKNMESLNESLDQGIKLFDEALQKGSKEMSESSLNLMNRLNSTMQVSIEKIKERRQRQFQHQHQLSTD